MYMDMYMLAAGFPYVRFCVFLRGGVGWADNVQWHLQTYVMLRYRRRLLHLQTYVMLRYRPRLLHLHDGVGWGGVGWADNVQWHLQTYVKLRYRRRLLHLQTYVMLRYRPRLLHLHDGVGWGGLITFNGTCRHTWCYATDVVSCTCRHTWCYATDLVSCTCRHTWCYASDGAKVYPKIAKTLKILNRSVSHATGEFQRTHRLHGSKVSVHTGGIDQAWKDLKKNVPNSIATRKDGAPNPLLWQYAAQWQWRWENSTCANLSRLTAETLRANMQWKSCRRKKSEKSNFFVVFLWRNANPSKN